jgi:cytochrome P450
MSKTTQGFPTVEGFDPLSDAFLSDPVPMILKALQTAPTFYHEPLKMWVITKHADICAAARDYETFSSKALGLIPPPDDLAHRVPPNMDKEIFITIDPPEHTGSRKAVAPFFTPGAVARMEQPTREIANRLIDGFIHKGQCDFMNDFAYRLSLEVIMQLVGIPPERAADYRRWTADLFTVFTPKSSAQPMSEEERRLHWSGLVECYEFFDALVSEREADPKEDLLTKMLQAKAPDGGPLVNRSRIRSNIFELVAAGNDTTANLMGAMLQLLEENPEQWEDLRRHPELLGNAAEETLRRRGSAPGLFRITTRDVEIGGATIPKGEIVWLLFIAGGLDDEKFENPKKFDIRRQSAGEHVAFGHGRHTCLGNMLARLEIKVGMEEFFRRIPDWRIVKGQKLHYLPTFTVLALEKLPIEWDPVRPTA